MNILSLGLGQYRTIADRGIYTDLLRSFVAHGHEVYILGSNPENLPGSPGLPKGRASMC